MNFENFIIPKRKKQTENLTLDHVMEEPIYECNICKDLGFIESKEDPDIMVECSCMKKKRYLKRLKNSGLSLRNTSRTFSNFIEYNEEYKEVKEIVQMEYCKKREYLNRNIVITGRVGSGKTHLAVALVNNILSKEVDVEYMSYRPFMTRVKQFIMDREEYDKLLRPKKETRVLFIDDLYKGNVTESDLNIMYEIMNYRYEEGLTTIVTSELSMLDILNYDEAVATRIYTEGKDRYVVMPDCNVRLKEYEQ